MHKRKETLDSRKTRDRRAKSYLFYQQTISYICSLSLSVYITESVCWQRIQQSTIRGSIDLIYLLGPNVE